MYGGILRGVGGGICRWRRSFEVVDCWLRGALFLGRIGQHFEGILRLLHARRATLQLRDGGYHGLEKRAHNFSFVDYLVQDMDSNLIPLDALSFSVFFLLFTLSVLALRRLNLL